MALVVASASLAAAVTPTTAPTVAFSLTLLLVALVSLTEPTSNSSTSLIAMEKTWSVCEPSLEVALTVMEREAPSASRSIAAATVTTPVLLSMAKRPPSLSNSE